MLAWIYGCFNSAKVEKYHSECSLPNHCWRTFWFTVYCPFVLSLREYVLSALKTQGENLIWKIHFLSRKSCRVLCTFRASMTRSRASSSPSRMLKSISSSGLVRLSIFSLGCEDREGEREQIRCLHAMYILVPKMKKLYTKPFKLSPTSDIQTEPLITSYIVLAVWEHNEFGSTEQ